jgi:hypothetical protein
MYLLNFEYQIMSTMVIANSTMATAITAGTAQTSAICDACIIFSIMIRAATPLIAPIQLENPLFIFPEI